MYQRLREMIAATRARQADLSLRTGETSDWGQTVELLEQRVVLSATTFPHTATETLAGINHNLNVTDVTNDTQTGAMGGGILFGPGKTIPTFTITVDVNGDMTPIHDFELQLVRVNDNAVVAATGRIDPQEAGADPADVDSIDLQLTTSQLSLGETTLFARFINHDRKDANQVPFQIDFDDADQQFTVRVNSPPTAVEKTFDVVEDGNMVLLNLGGDDDDGDALSTLIDIPNDFEGALFTPAGIPISDGDTVTGTQVRYSPPANENGSPLTSFGFQFADGREMSTQETATINVTSVDDSPFVQMPIGTVNAEEGDPNRTFDLSTVFDDPDIATDGDTLAFSVVSNTNPTLVMPSISGDTLTLDFQPSQSGTADITIRATDSTNRTAEDMFTVNVNSVLDDPVITGFTDNVAEITGPMGDGDLTNDDLPEVSGTAEEGAEITVHLGSDTGPVLGPKVTVDASQEWQLQLDSPLADGTNTLIAVAERGAERTFSNPFAIDVDTMLQMPAIAGIVEDTGESSSDNITSDTTPTFNGTADGMDASSPVAISVKNAAGIVVAQANVDAAGNWTAPFGGSPLAIGSHTFTADARDAAGNVRPSSPFTVFIDTEDPVVNNIMLIDGDTIDSNLPVPVTDSRRPTFQFDLTEHAFQGATNSVAVELRNLETGERLATETFDFTLNGQPEGPVTLENLTIRPDDDLPLSSDGNTVVSVFLRVIDQAGNANTDQVGPPNGEVDPPTNAEQLTFFINSVAAPTQDAPGTPVFSLQYDLEEILKEAGIVNPEEFGLTNHVWQMSFDKTTQTVWINTEKGNQTFQFDPATGDVRVYDFAEILWDEEEDVVTAQNPHGLFFDFNSHVNPRVWVVHRNAGGTSAGPGAEGGVGRLSYIDLRTNEVVTFDFNDFLKAADIPADESGLEDFHAVFVDARGTVWVAAAHSDRILEIDFDDSSITSSIDSKTARVTVHNIPEQLLQQGPAGGSDEFDAHGLDVIIDDKTGEAYVWFVAVGGSGRLGLLRPGAGDGGHDVWATWDMPDQFENVLIPFVEIDDNETPGDPRDDRAVFMAPVALPPPAMPGSGVANTEGLVHVFDPGINPADPMSFSNGRLRSYRIDVQPGAPTEFAATNQPFISRDGGIYFIDRFGGVGQLDPDSAVSTLEDISPDRLISVAESVERTFEISLKTVGFEPKEITMAIPTSNTVNDRSNTMGVDQYEVAAPGGGIGRGAGQGPFRGALNAANVLFGSHSRHDVISSTVFTEIDRRQMSVVELPDKPAGALVEGRMAFQVIRTELDDQNRQTGALIMTHRDHGEILDQQVNLTRLLAEQPDVDAVDIGFTSDPEAIIDASGDVHVIGRNDAGGLVRYRLDAATQEWSVDSFNPPQFANGQPGVIAGKPDVLLDASGNPLIFVTASVLNGTEHEGHLLMYGPNGMDAVDQTAMANGPNIYGNVDTLGGAGTGLSIFGVDMQGGVVEYQLNENLTPTAAHTLMVDGMGLPQHDTRILQAVYTAEFNGQRHVFGSDGTSRMVQLTLNGDGTATARNITEEAKASATGYFSFQEGFEARVYNGIKTVIADDPTSGDPRLFIYGTNGGELVEFEFDGSTWAAHNLTNDTTAGGEERTPANAVFGAPDAYVTADGSRHILQTNAEGEVVEYVFDRSITRFDQQANGFVSDPRYTTRNINLANGNEVQDLRRVTEPTIIEIAGGPALVEANSDPVTLAPDASVQSPLDNFDGVTLIVRLADGRMDDLISIQNQGFVTGQIGVAGMTVTYEGTPIGKVNNLDPDVPDKLSVDLNNNAELESVEALLRALTFSSTGAFGLRSLEISLVRDGESLGDRVSTAIGVTPAGTLDDPIVPLLGVV